MPVTGSIPPLSMQVMDQISGYLHKPSDFASLCLSNKVFYQCLWNQPAILLQYRRIHDLIVLHPNYQPLHAYIDFVIKNKSRHEKSELLNLVLNEAVLHGPAELLRIIVGKGNEAGHCWNTKHVLKLVIDHKKWENLQQLLVLNEFSDRELRLSLILDYLSVFAPKQKYVQRETIDIVIRLVGNSEYLGHETLKSILSGWRDHEYSKERVATRFLRKGIRCEPQKVLKMLTSNSELPESVLDAVLERGASISRLATENVQDLLPVLESGNQVLLNLLCETGACLAAHELTPMIIDKFHANTEIIRKMIQHGIKVSSANVYSLMMESIFHRNFQLFCYFHDLYGNDFGADCEIEMLEQAILAGSLEILRYLSEKKFNVAAVSRRVIDVAIGACRFRVMDWLLWKKMIPYTQTDLNEWLIFAARIDMGLMIDTLLDHGADARYQNDLCMLYAVINGNYSFIQRLIEEGAGLPPLPEPHECLDSNDAYSPEHKKAGLHAKLLLVADRRPTTREYAHEILSDVRSTANYRYSDLHVKMMHGRHFCPGILKFEGTYVCVNHLEESIKILLKRGRNTVTNYLWYFVAQANLKYDKSFLNFLSEHDLLKK